MFDGLNTPMPSGTFYPPLLYKPYSLQAYTNLPEEIKKSIEEHRNEFETEEDLRNFIKIQKLKS